MPVTYEPIATTTLGSATSTITFSGISGSYTDLRLVWIGQRTSGTGDVLLRLNSDSGTNYSTTYIYGDGTTVAAQRLLNETSMRASFTFSASTNSMAQFDILSYSGSAYKTALSVFSGDYNGTGRTQINSHYWRNTSAITSISLIADATTFKVGTTAALYGILKA
jgi:hypothetical protein